MFSLLDRIKVNASEERDCAICFCDLAVGSAMRLPCKHTFHQECICKWLQLSEVYTCPMCRQQVKFSLKSKPGEPPFDEDLKSAMDAIQWSGYTTVIWFKCGSCLQMPTGS